MIVGTLKQKFSVAAPVIALCYILMLIPSFFYTSAYISVDSRNVLHFLIQQRLQSNVAVHTVNILVLLIGAMLISYYSIRHEITDKQNYIPAFLYLFFGQIASGTGLTHASFFANIFILSALSSVTSTYRSENVLSGIFNAGFYTGIAVFFYLNYTFFIILFFIALIIIRPFNWREWLIGVLGFLIPVFIYSCMGYLFNYDFTIFFDNFFDLFSYFQKLLISEYYYPLFVFTCILLIIVVFNHLKNGLGSKVKTQKLTGLMYWFLVLSFINFFSKNNDYYFPALASVIPLCILFGNYFYEIKQLKIANTLFFILMAAGSILVLMRLGVF